MDSKALDKVARRNHGIVTVKDVDKLVGIPRRNWLVKQKRLIPVHRGVYRVVGAPITFEQRCVAAALASGSDALVSHLSALRLYGLGPKNNAVHLTVTKKKSHCLAGVKVHRADVRARDKTKVNGMAMTGVARTLFDCAGLLTPKQLEKAIDDAVVAGICSYSLMQQTAISVGTNGRKGAHQFMKLLNERLPIGDVNVNEQELRLHKIIARAKLPTPTSKHIVWHSQTRWYEIDIAWPEFKIALEFEGFQAHGTSRKRFDYDRMRRNYLRLEAWDLVEFTAKMTDAAILATIKQALRRKGVGC